MSNQITAKLRSGDTRRHITNAGLILDNVNGAGWTKKGKIKEGMKIHEFVTYLMEGAWQLEEFNGNEILDQRIGYAMAALNATEVIYSKGIKERKST